MPMMAKILPSGLWMVGLMVGIYVGVSGWVRVDACLSGFACSMRYVREHEPQTDKAKGLDAVFDVGDEGHELGLADEPFRILEIQTGFLQTSHDVDIVHELDVFAGHAVHRRLRV